MNEDWLMEREGIGTKYMAVNCEGSQSPPRAVALRKKVWKWLRQQSKDFYAEGFDVLIKQWNKCINVGGGYVEK
jgi:hypothetical protein